MSMEFDGSPFDSDPFTDPDLCTQVEDDDPETLAGDPVTFDPSADNGAV